MRKKTCIGLVVKNRWELTEKTLNSLFYSDQDKKSYEVILIDNGSSKETQEKLKDYVKSSLLPIRNLVIMKEMSVSQAWNLFLCLSQEFENRIKFDNDLILNNTIVPSTQPFSVKRNTPAPNEAEALAMSGSPMSVSVVRGRTISHRRKENILLKHSRFIEHMLDFSEQGNVDLVSLVPVSPNQTFASMLNAIQGRTRNKMPYLFGACMLITRKAFDTLGYFDERLPRRIDIEYSQRAIKNKLNIGYHPFYGVTHIGVGKSTEKQEEIDQKYHEANSIEDTQPAIETRGYSEWEGVFKSLKRYCYGNKVLSLS